MARQMWLQIRDSLAEEIERGQLEPGDRLPTEPQLAQRFLAGRHSVRRAIEALAKDGKLSVEQGRGTFVSEEPKLTYTIGRRTRLHRNLVPQGCEVTSELMQAGIEVAKPQVRDTLRLKDGEKVVVSGRRTLANGWPVSFGTVHHPVHRFPDFVERRDLLGSTTETYRTYGIFDYVRQSTQMIARPATPDEAQMLRQHPDLSVVVIHAVDADMEGVPIACSEVIWAAGRVRFLVGGADDD